ncbi:MAG: hypothetical protein JWO44_1697 [Bacteroidetes bacterium]|nr:hypothetical protein [Bacteroidota bacterium]
MSRLFFKYYIDITRINILVTIVFGLLTKVFGLLTNYIICFGTFGILISFLIYRQFQNQQYYFYQNQGYTKTELMAKVFTINFSIALILFLIIK